MHVILRKSHTSRKLALKQCYRKKKKKWCNRCGKLVLELIAGLLQFSFDPSTIHYNSLDLRGQKMISYDDK